MRRISRKLGGLALLCGGLAVIWPSEGNAQRHPVGGNPQFAATAQKASMAERITSSVKQGFGKVADMVSPEATVTPAPDPISLATQSNPRPKLYVSVARLYEESGQFREAAGHYERALRLQPSHLSALLGYARIKDHLGDIEGATKLYQRAAKAHPKEAAVFNNLGAFYGRHGRVNEAVDALNRAIQLQPKQAKYRNNMAVLLVEMGRTNEALVHLRAVSPEAVAYYNLGFLLNKKGQTQAATQHFAAALRINPAMAQARQMLQRTAMAAARRPQTAPGVGARLSSRPTRAAAPSVPQQPAPQQPAPQQPAPQQQVPQQQVPQQEIRRGAVHQLPPPPRRSASQPARSQPANTRPAATRPRPGPVQRSGGLQRLPPISRRPTPMGDAPPWPTGPIVRPSSSPVAAPMPPRSAAGPATQALPRMN